MNFVKFNPKKVSELKVESKYNLVLNDSSVVCAELRSTGHIKNNGVYHFVENDEKVHMLDTINFISPRIEFSYVSVGDGFALTKNGSKVFPENVYGIIDNEEYAKHYVHFMNHNTNTYTPDMIKRSDIVECISKYFYTGEKAIVIDVIKPRTLDDHGCIEVYLLTSMVFEHFTYTGWTEFLKVIEEY